MSKSHSTKDGHANKDDTEKHLYLKEMVGLDIAITINRLIVKRIIIIPYKIGRWYSTNHERSILAYCRYLGYMCDCCSRGMVILRTELQGQRDEINEFKVYHGVYGLSH